MDDKQQRHPLSDSDLDRALEATLGVEPSPDFLARVRTRLGSDQDVSPLPLMLGQKGGLPLVGLVVVGLALVVVLPSWTRDETQRRPGPVPMAAIDEVPRSETHIAHPPTTRRTVVDRGPERMRRSVPEVKPLSLSPALFSDEHRRALERLLVAVEEGRVPPMPKTEQANDQSGAIRELRIEPLVIEPLPPLRVEELGAGE